jgi:hypothetical protein
VIKTTRLIFETVEGFPESAVDALGAAATVGWAGDIVEASEDTEAAGSLHPKTLTQHTRAISRIRMKADVARHAKGVTCKSRKRAFYARWLEPSAAMASTHARGVNVRITFADVSCDPIAWRKLSR